MTCCRETLRQIFHQADLDGDGLLSKREFSLYNLRVSGEEAGDDIWEVVQGVTSHTRFTVFKIMLLMGCGATFLPHSQTTRY